MNGSGPQLKPMPLWQALLYFGVPMALECVIIYAVLPALNAAGVHHFIGFVVSALPMVLMLVAALVAHRLEGRPLAWHAVRDRLRLGPMRARGWWWSVGLALFTLASYVGVSFPIGPLAEKLPPAEAFGEILGNQTTFVGFPMKGAWWLLGVWFVFYLFNVLGEELWWRGYILPRQELAHGRFTWVVHGILWTLFHIFYLVEMLMLLPGALALAWVCQREKSTWPGIVAHGFLNAMAAIRIVLGILG